MAAAGGAGALPGEGGGIRRRCTASPHGSPHRRGAGPTPSPARRTARGADPAPPTTPPTPDMPAPAPLVAPAGFRIAAPSEVPAGAALVGRAVLYQWPTEGWVRGTVARRSRAAGFSHVVRYGRTSALGSVVTPSLLDAASHGPAGRWVLLVRSAR